MVGLFMLLCNLSYSDSMLPLEIVLMLFMFSPKALVEGGMFYSISEFGVSFSLGRVSLRLPPIITSLKMLSSFIQFSPSTIIKS